MSAPPIFFARLWLPRPGIEEDAEPLIVQSEAHPAVALLGVFDGLGGAGARRVTGEHGERSAAWYAARMAREAARACFEPMLAEPGRGLHEDTLAAAMRAPLLAAEAASPTMPGQLRSSMIRPYPTTAALLAIGMMEDATHAVAFWAGDSRCYVLRPQEGLQLLTRDDSRAGDDPLRALRDEPRLTNLVSAQPGWRLNRHAVPFAPGEPLVLIAATDGAFGCLPSPMHFEWVLLHALADAAEKTEDEDFQAALHRQLEPIRQDDITLVAAFLNWPSIGAASAAFEERRKRIADDIHRIDLFRLGASDDPALAEGLPLGIEEAWNDYRAGHLALMAPEVTA